MHAASCTSTLTLDMLESTLPWSIPFFIINISCSVVPELSSGGNKQVTFFFSVEQIWRQIWFVFISFTVLFAYFQICKKYQLHCQRAQKASRSAFLYYARYILEVKLVRVAFHTLCRGARHWNSGYNLGYRIKLTMDNLSRSLALHCGQTQTVMLYIRSGLDCHLSPWCLSLHRIGILLYKQLLQNAMGIFFWFSAIHGLCTHIPELSL